jgi:ATP-dependent RNA helicase RhlB
MMERILCARLNLEQATEADREIAGKRAFPDWKPNQFVLVLVPTRELCEQVYENAVSLAGDSGLRAVSIYGGVSYDKQKQGLRDGVEFVIATPGRLIDLYKEHLCDMKQVRAIIFDEADRMFDMGFKDDMKFILQRVPKERQFLVFSATLNMDVMSTAYQFGANPIDVDVSRDQPKAENVDDKIFHVGSDEKAMYLLSLLRVHKPKQAIIFSNFKMNVPRISQFLNDNAVPAVGISSLLTQTQRARVMEQFKSDASDRNILVATDVAARGLDIKGVDMVVNFELPDDAENYIHRIGRTGRAGAKGIAFSLVGDRDVESLGRIEEYLRHKVDAGWIEDTDLVKDYVAMPSDRGYRDGGGRGGPRAFAGGGRRDSRSGSGPQGRDRGAGRGGAGDREARGARGPRSGRSGDNRERRPAEALADAGSGARDLAAAGPRVDGEPRQHRDRVSGRHAGPGRGRDLQRADGRAGDRDGRSEGRPSSGRGGRSPGEQNRDGRGRPATAGGPGSTVGRNGSGRPGQNARAGNGHGGPGRPIPRGAQQAAKGGGGQPSLGKKVTGFFKKLFGGGSGPKNPERR